MQKNVINEVFYATEAIPKNRAVVADPTVDRGVKLPGAEGASHFVGVTQDDYCTAAGNISVAIFGQVEVLADGAITSGDYLEIASTAGDVQNGENATPEATWVIGMAVADAANDTLVKVDLSKQGYMTV